MKPLEDFVAHRGKPDGRSSYCRPCHGDRVREWKTANVDRFRVVRREQKRRARRRVRSREKPVVVGKRCRSCGETKARSAFSPDAGCRDGLYEKCKVCRVRWYWSVDRVAIFDRDAGRCHLCGGSADVGDFHLDHIVPRSLGGRDEPSNLAVAHPVCNMRRGNRDVATFVGVD